MAGTTTNYGFPYPEATDLVTNGAADIQALADAVDSDLKAEADARTAQDTATDARFPGAKMRRGVQGVSFNSAGVGTIPHGLGANVVVGIVCPASHYGDDWSVMFDGADSNSTNLAVKAANAGGAIVNQTRTVAWLAIS